MKQVIITLAFLSVASIPLSPAHAKTDLRIDEAEYVKTVDGDTFYARLKRTRTIERVRLLGIDTPELHHPDKPEECYAEQAATALQTSIKGKQLYLITDPINQNRDTYGRLLRYVIAKDTNDSEQPVTFVNQALLSQGNAYAYIRYNFRLKGYFEQVANYAKNKKRGLWNKATCNGKR